MKNLYQTWTIGGSGYAVLQDKLIVIMRNNVKDGEDEGGEEYKYKIITASKKAIPKLTYNAVDLGLPSGTLWADRNVGATSPENFGVYFAWGETEGFTSEVKNATAEEVCNLFNPLLLEWEGITMTPDNIDETLSMMGMLDDATNLVLIGTISEKCFSSDWSDYFDTTDGGDTFIKYNDNSNLTILQPEDDAATVNMGSDWRIPTSNEMYELIDNTTQIFIDFDGNEIDGDGNTRRLKGIRFIGINGNSIFLPNAGYGRDSLIMGDALLPYSDYLGGGNEGYCRGIRIVYSLFGVSCGGLTEEESRYTGLTIRGVKSIN